MASPVEIYTRDQVFHFTIMACCGAEISLHKNDQDFYLIVLGSDSGNKIQVHTP